MSAHDKRLTSIIASHAREHGVQFETTSAVMMSPHQSRSCFTPNPNPQASVPSLNTQHPVITMFATSAPPPRPLKTQISNSCRRWGRRDTRVQREGRGGRQGVPTVRSLSNLVLTCIRGLLQQRTRAWQIKIMGPRLLVYFFCRMNRLKSCFIVCPPRKHVLVCGLRNRICNKLDFYESFTDIK